MKFSKQIVKFGLLRSLRTTVCKGMLICELGVPVVIL